MIEEAPQGVLQEIANAFGQVRAEYESDAALRQRFAPPLYFPKLVGITPTFLIGGRGTGKTTTLRSMSYGGQVSVSGTVDIRKWQVVGAYWKVEPNLVSAFRGRGLSDTQWTRIFSHYLNLRLSSLLLDFATWLLENGVAVELKPHYAGLLMRSLHLGPAEGVSEITKAIDIAMVDIESKLNGNISALAASDLSVLGKPLEYLFKALDGVGLGRERPFMFCLDEYENLDRDQQRVLNTLVKQVGSAPYTFKIGVRNTVSIDSSTLVSGQPLQDPADFTKVDIVTDLKDESFEEFASTVVGQRLALIGSKSLRPHELLPSVSLDEEADRLGAEALKRQLAREVERDALSDQADVDFIDRISALEASLLLRWASFHGETPATAVRWARNYPGKWRTRVVNYGYATLFTIRENRVGRRKYYAGWKTFCQLADGNIRYMIRLVHEALHLHALDGGNLMIPVVVEHQTTAAARVGERTVRDLQGWSRQGAALTRLSLGLGSIFGNLAREAAFGTPEVNQFRVGSAGNSGAYREVELLLAEAVGQGILIGFEGDKNARLSGATAEIDYQLHPILSAFFVYSPRRKRRMTLQASEILSLTERETAPVTIRRVLSRRGTSPDRLPDQLTIFSET